MIKIFITISMTIFFIKYDNIVVIAGNPKCNFNVFNACEDLISGESECINLGCCYVNAAFGFGGCFKPICVEGCDKCVNSETCEVCKQKYYLTEDTKKCYSEVINNYYLDGNTLKRCHQNCLQCSNSKNDNCIKCQSNYYLTEDTQSCYSKEINNYYLDGNTLKKCHPNCLKCINNQNSECILCQSNYFMTEDTNSCYNEIIDNYYIDNNILRKCHPNCLRCSDSDNINCISCQKNFYLTEDTKSCYNEIIDNYYLDNNILKRCHPNCMRCNSSSLNDTFMNCDACGPSYYLTEDTKSCYNEVIDNYYLDNNILRKCHPNCKTCNNSFNDDNMNCILCKDGFYKLNGTYNCYKILNDSFYFKDDTFFPCDENCLTCSKGKNETSNNCLSCDFEYKKLYLVEDLNNCEYSNYSGYYLDKEKLILKKCYNSCKSCLGALEINNHINEENHNCIECNDNFYKLPSGLYPNNCYDSETIQSWKIISISTDLIKNDISEKERKISNFKENLMNGKLDNILKNITENKKDYVEEEKDMKIQLTTSESQKNNSNKNISTIDLGQCEQKLRDIYVINETLPLIILKIDYYSKDTLIPIVGYEIYHPVNKSRLDLKYCEEILIKLNIPVSIDENNLFKYDPNSEYYRDSCYSYTTENGTDIILNDRKKEFSNNNLSLCEINCNYSGYNIEDKHSSCDCHIKNKMDLISEIVDNPNKLSNEFNSNDTSSSSSNIISIKCAKALFTSAGLKNNISSYVLLIIIFYFMLSLLLFIKCGFPLLQSNINEIINKKKKRNNKIKIEKTKRNKKKKGKKLAFPLKNINFNIINNINTDNSKKKIIKINENINNKIKLKKSLKKNIIGKPNDLKLENKLVLSKKIKNPEKKIKLNFNDFELNTMCYKEVLIYDKRSFCDYYISLIKSKHPILFGFCPFKDYNSIIIKSCIFFLSFSIFYAMNFVFFNEEIIHKIYEDNGKYDFIYFIPQICISFAASHVLTIIIKLIFLSERNLREVNEQKTYISAYDISTKTRTNLIIKYSVFFILGLIFLGIFWLFLSSFGAVYQNTQVFVFENTLISFGISLIYPFFINIIPSIFRICSLTRKTECIYNFSKVTQLL